MLDVRTLLAFRQFRALAGGVIQQIREAKYERMHPQFLTMSVTDDQWIKSPNLNLASPCPVHS
jgi:hypothetical protein